MCDVLTESLTAFCQHGGCVTGTPADDTEDEIGGQIEKFISALVELLVDVPVL